MLKPLRTKPKWTTFRTYDLEWNPFTMQVRCGVVYDGLRHYWYYTPEELLEHQLTARNSGVTWYAHNGGRADFSYLLRFLKTRDYQVDACFSNSSANIVVVSKGRCRWHFVDSLWLFASSLAKIGESIGVAKSGPTVEEYDGDDYRERIKDWYATVPLPELLDYCKNDCEILWRAIYAFQHELWAMGAEMKKTIASTAMSLFKRRYLKEPIKTNAAINLVSRESYAASRVEVFGSEMTDGSYYDINSSFPYSMTKPQPGSLKRIHTTLPDLLHEDVPLLLADCEIEVPELTMPPLALRANTKVYYPIGRWRSWFTGIDLRALVERGGRILKCGRAYEFEPFNDMAQYVDEIYSRRMKATAAGDAFKSMVYKILLNSLYGKYAEGREKTGLILNPSGKQVEQYGLRFPKNEKEQKEFNRNPNCPTHLFTGAWVVKKSVDIPHEHVPVASNVTAYSRLLLLQHMEQAEVKGGRAYYCDTDGFATDVPYDTTPELGGLKEEMRIVSGHFYKPKVYDLQGEKGRRVKAKGFALPSAQNHPKQREAQYERLIRSAHSPQNTGILIERMLRPQEMLKHRKSLTPLEVAGMKKLVLENPKRFTYKDGTTRAWHVKEVAPELAL